MRLGAGRCAAFGFGTARPGTRPPALARDPTPTRLCWRPRISPLPVAKVTPVPSAFGRVELAWHAPSHKPRAPPPPEPSTIDRSPPAAETDATAASLSATLKSASREAGPRVVVREPKHLYLPQSPRSRAAAEAEQVGGGQSGGGQPGGGCGPGRPARARTRGPRPAPRTPPPRLPARAAWTPRRRSRCVPQTDLIKEMFQEMGDIGLKPVVVYHNLR